MRHYFIILLFVIFGTACGSTRSKQDSPINQESILAKYEKDAYVIESNGNKQLFFLFYDESNQLISRSDTDFPVGAFEAKLYIKDSNVEIKNATFTTCCGKTFEINFSSTDEDGFVLLQEFSLGNNKHKLSIYFSDDDVAVLSKESL